MSVAVVLSGSTVSLGAIQVGALRALYERGVAAEHMAPAWVLGGEMELARGRCQLRGLSPPAPT